LILGIIAVVLSPLYLPESVLTRFTSIGNMADSSTSFRVYIWMGTLAMLKDYWFCGVGPGTEAFNLVYPNYAYSAIEAPHSHNLYLQILCDTGVVGLGLFLGLMVCFYRMMFTAIRREGDRTSRIFQIAGVSAVSGFLLQSMTDYTFYNYRVMFLFWAVLGLCTAFCRAGQEVRRD
jgi:putative inorganic carbon (HCO3(-)) transporter